MCWPSLRRLWMRILGINSPVAFFLTFTRYQYANVIPVLKFVVWYKFILHLTVMFTYSHTYWCAYTWKNKNKPNKRQKWDCVHSAQFNLHVPVSLTSSPTACQFRSGFYWTRTPIISYPGQFTTNMRQYWLPKSKHIASWLLKSLSWLSKQ